MTFRFDVFEMDVSARELRKAGARVKLQEQPWLVLLALLERAGQLVTREELRQHLWTTDTFVDFDHSLNVAINKIRDALDDAAGAPRFIETIPRRGYRIIVPVERVPDSPSQSNDANTTKGAPHPGMRLAAVAIVLILAAAVFAGARLRWLERSVPTIAVLPLKNLSTNPETDYFADGLSDQITYDLSVIQGLEVKSRTSSFLFKGHESSVRDIGRQLQVDFVLEGTVLREGQRLRLTASLVRVSDDVRLWSDRYDRDLVDVLAVQDEIARSIANELRLKGVGGQRRYDTNVDVYDLYLRARALANENGMGSDPTLDRAVDLFHQITIKDGQFAPAYAGLAEAYAHLRNRGRSRQSTALMRAAAERAIALDPLLSDAYISLGDAYASDLRWHDAESAFTRAMALNPNSVWAHVDFALYVLLPMERTDEALAQTRKGLELDPLSSSRRKALTYALLRAGRYTEARATIEPVLLTDPGDQAVKQLEARALWWSGERERALIMFEKLSRPSHGYLGWAYARLGRRAEAEALAGEDDEAQVRHQLLIYAGLGDRDRCLEALRAMAAADDYAADIFPGDPELASIRDDPRIEDFRQQRGLPARQGR